MAERKTGLGTLPTGLIRPTTPHEVAEVPESAEGMGASTDDLAEPSEGQGRGPTAGKATVTRRKRPTPGGETKGRKLQLPDDIHDRLWLMARQRRKTVSAVAAEILDRNLPRFTVTKEG